MNGVRLLGVSEDEADLRLDRWFRRRFPEIPHAHLERLLRRGEVRVDGKRAKAGQRLMAGQEVRIPPLGREETPPPRPSRPGPSESEAAALLSSVLFRDDDVIVLNKPPGLAVQGGSRTHRHLDGMLDALRFGNSERPRLVHRLDKDTSGVLLLARNAAAAARLAGSLRRREARKIYWALTAGVPTRRAGRIELPLAKRQGAKGERVAGDEDAGKRAATLYSVVATAGRRAAWLALMPLTGRTHQLRVHCAALGAPIQGDGKYGAGFLTGEGISRKLHLHAREIALPHPKGGVLSVTAPLPEHMAASWRLLGFDPEYPGDPFAGIKAAPQPKTAATRP